MSARPHHRAQPRASQLVRRPGPALSRAPEAYDVANRTQGDEQLTFEYGSESNPVPGASDPDAPPERAIYSAIKGHIAVGRYILEVGDPFGGRIREASQDGGASTRPRPAPVLQRPRVIRGLVGRQAELATALAALEAGLPLEVSGDAGVGKTAFLRHLAHHPHAASFDDGIVYLSARHQSCADILQLLFEAFYESDGVQKAADARIRRDLRGKRALILLDDVRLAHAELDQVFEIAPGCAFVVATHTRYLWDEGRNLTLAGLNAEDAVSLLERAVERPLDDSERPAAMRLCELLGGHPLRILQAAALVREKRIALDPGPADIGPDGLITQLMKSIDERQRRALLALISLPGVPLSVQHISAIAEITDLEPTIQALLGLGLVVREQARYQAAAGVADRLRRREDLGPWIHRAITYFTAWTSRFQRNPSVLLEEAEALLRTQQSAAETRRSGEVLRIGRLLEGALIVGGRWGAWAHVLERCLDAAKATGDRSAEAWALHQLGTRAVCVGDDSAARSLLGRAVAIRETLGDTVALAASRQNLGFVVAPVSMAPSEPRVLPVAIDFDRLPLRDAAPPIAGMRRPTSLAAVAVMAVLLAAVGWFAGMAVDAVRSRPSTPRPEAPRAVAAPMATTGDAGAGTGAVLETTADVPPAAAANILIFTARPGSVAPARSTEICYAVKDAFQARIEPGIGDVDPASTLTCRRVAPARTTTYRLTAIGRDGNHHSQSVVVVVR
jgi:hypothetical protein